MKRYEFVIIGAGIAGTALAYFLSKASDNILLIDKKNGVAQGASGAAGAFLSPLLGKPNKFKDLVNNALRFSTQFYKENFSDYIINNGVLRIPKNESDSEKFLAYEKDFPYMVRENGYFFEIGSLVFSWQMCMALSKNIQTCFDYEIQEIAFDDGYWVLNNHIQAKHLIFATGAYISILPEQYIKIRPVWGQRIIVQTSTNLTHNYHKECSLSPTIDNKVSIGATHHRFVLEREVSDEDTQKLLQLANEITKLQDVRVVGALGGARSASKDYFPIVGEIIDSKATLKEFPYIIHGTKVNPDRFTRYRKLFILSGLGGRGFVLAPYLAQLLSEHIVNGTILPQEILPDRFFLREVKK